MIITDIRGISFPACPRCGGEWKHFSPYSNDEHPSCKYTCSDGSCLYFSTHYEPRDKFLYFLSWFSGAGHLVQWTKEGTWILVYGLDDEPSEKLQELTLPTIPYNITLAKLKTYILFS